MLRAGLTVDDLAECAGVETKTVERWISMRRVPHRQHRWATAKRLGVDESYLWPEVLSRSPARREQAGRSELVEVYPDRVSVPRELWLRVLDEVQDHVDVLVFTREETGVTVEVTGLLGVFSDPGHIVAYGDGEIRQEYEVMLLARAVSGAPTVNDEASEVRWVAPADLADLDIHPTQWRQLNHYLNRSYPHVD
jgi:transcriptional regulator with XRE-family HTH domain